MRVCMLLLYIINIYGKEICEYLGTSHCFIIRNATNRISTSSSALVACKSVLFRVMFLTRKNDKCHNATLLELLYII